MPKIIHIEERVEIPPGVEAEVNGLQVRVRGPKGEVFRDFSHVKGINIRVENNEVVVEAHRANRKIKAVLG
ncbi:MAG: 50S ribosomal protein L6, partial [Desulfurococcaceae archaeon]